MTGAEIVDMIHENAKDGISLSLSSVGVIALSKRLENMQKVIDEAMSIRCALSGLQGNAKSLGEALNLCFKSLTNVRYLIEEPPAGSP